MRSLVLTLGALSLGASSLHAEEGWITNMDEAMALASKEGKHILMDFTGSDWCGWCIKLKDEVFTKDEFRAEAPKHFVLVELDFPQRKQLAPEQVEHNKTWGDRFEIQGYPTIVLTDAEGKPYARTGYREGGPESYLEHLAALRDGKSAMDALMAKADAAKGVERARLLDQALESAADGVVVADRDAVMAEIVSLDADDAAGLKSKYEVILSEKTMDEALSGIERALFTEGPDAAMEQITAFEAAHADPGSRRGALIRMKVMAKHMGGMVEEAVALVDAGVADESLDAEARQQVALVGFQLYMQEGNGAKAKEFFETALRIAPDSELGAMLAKQKDQVLSMIEQQLGGDEEDGG